MKKLDKQKIIKTFWEYYTYLGQLPFIGMPLFLFYYFIDNKIYVFHLLLFIGVLMWLWALTKFLFFKPRPKKQEYSNFIEKIKAGSFPSIHTTNTFSVFVFACMYMNIYGILGFGVYSVGIMYSRIYLKKHFWIDVFWWIFYVIFWLWVYQLILDLT